jgi:hypothetical protein
MSDAQPTELELELDADALAMLRAYRTDERIPAEVHDRVWSRVRADVEPSPGRWLRYGALTGLLAAAAVGVLWMGGRLLRAEPPAPPGSQAGYQGKGSAPEGTATPRAPEQATPRRHASGEPPAGTTPGATASDAAATALDDDRATPGATATSTDPSPSSSGRRGAADVDRRAAPTAQSGPAPGSTLAEENRLLARARAALLDADPGQALARLDEHARRFPDGVLSEERQALRAVALCEAGRDADGHAAAKAFLREHPQAALAERVRGACLE